MLATTKYVIWGARAVKRANILVSKELSVSEEPSTKSSLRSDFMIEEETKVSTVQCFDVTSFLGSDYFSTC